MFKVSGHDILVLPRKYVDELRNLPDSVISSIQANIDVCHDSRRRIRHTNTV